MVNIFTYGSLMCNDIMFGVSGCEAESCKATLKDYYRSKIKNEEYPAVLPRFKAEVEGILYFDLSESAIARLDAFEGEYYDRQGVQVWTGENVAKAAMIYVIKPQYYNLLTYSEWSYDRFLKVGKQKFEEAYFGFNEI